jgi:hypothetical protein
MYIFFNVGLKSTLELMLLQIKVNNNNKQRSFLYDCNKTIVMWLLSSFAALITCCPRMSWWSINEESNHITIVLLQSYRNDLCLLLLFTFICFLHFFFFRIKLVFFFTRTTKPICNFANSVVLMFNININYYVFIFDVCLYWCKINNKYSVLYFHISCV